MVRQSTKAISWLADSYDISEDGTSYTFHLNKSATFHDGSPVEASDVVYSIERILALKKGAYSLFTKSVLPGSTKVIDKHTVQFNLVEASSIFLATVPAIHVLNSSLVQSHEVDGDLELNGFLKMTQGLVLLSLTDMIQQ